MEEMFPGRQEMATQVMWGPVPLICVDVITSLLSLTGRITYCEPWLFCDKACFL